MSDAACSIKGSPLPRWWDADDAAVRRCQENERILEKLVQILSPFMFRRLKREVDRLEAEPNVGVPQVAPGGRLGGSLSEGPPPARGLRLW